MTARSDENQPLTTEQVDAAIRLAEYLRKRNNAVRRGRFAKKAAAFVSLPFGAGLIVPEHWWKGNKR